MVLMQPRARFGHVAAARGCLVAARCSRVALAACLPASRACAAGQDPLAGDMAFVQELPDRTLYSSSARGGSAEVFRLLLDHAMSPRCSTNCRDGEGGSRTGGGRGSMFRLEMMSRAVHAAARGGSMEMLKELIERRSDVSEYLDVRGSTVLHAAAGRGQLDGLVI